MKITLTFLLVAITIYTQTQRAFSTEEHKRIIWERPRSRPVIRPPFPSPVIADPSFLTPDQSLDSNWHLFAHTIFGIRQYISTDGIKWKTSGPMVAKKSMRAFITKDQNTYYLFYEKTDKYAPYASHIEIKKSADLKNWSNPTVILKADEKYSREGAPKGPIGNACVVKTDDGYRLYFSAGLVYLKDCGFSEPRYICYATASSIEGPYTWAAKPVISPDSADPYRNAGAGAVKVYKTSDGYVGYENGITLLKDGHSYSSITLLESKDGIDWSKASIEPFLKPTTGWQRDYVYALDLRFYNGKFYLFYNARRGHHWSVGREAIGVITGELK